MKYYEKESGDEFKFGQKHVINDVYITFTKEFYENNKQFFIVKQKLFTTYDGVDIYQGDNYYVIFNNDIFRYPSSINYCGSNKCFSSIKAAEKYLYHFSIQIHIDTLYGMDQITIPEIFNDYVNNGWSAGNMATGSGGGLLTNDLKRDTDRAAIKACFAEIDGKEIDICKTPKSDLSKSSKKGRLKLHKSGNSFTTIESSKETPEMFHSYTDELETVFENGELKRDQSFTEIRKIANSHL